MWPSIPGFHLKRRLGHGACGEVFEATDVNGQRCALKVLDPEAINAYYVEYCYGPHGPLAAPEAQQCWPLELARVLAYQAADLVQSAFYALPLWADWLPQQNTWQPRAAWPHAIQAGSAAVWQWVEDIAAAMAFLHRHRVVHGNIKPSNAFLGSPFIVGEPPPSAVLSDWGQGWLGGAAALPLSDHVFFAPPEQLCHPDEIENGAGQRWDVYAFGATAYTLLTSRFARGHHHANLWLQPPPPEALPDPTTFANIILQEPGLLWPFPPTDAQEHAKRRVLERCLALAPEARFADGEEILAALVEASRPRAVHVSAPTSELPAAPPVSAHVPVRSWRRPAMAATLLSGAAMAAVCGWGWHSAHRHLRREQQLRAELEQTLATRTTAHDARLTETTAALGAVQETLQHLTAAHERLEVDFTLVFEHFLQAVMNVPAARERTRLLQLGQAHLVDFISQSEGRPELTPARLRARVNVAKITAMLTPVEAVETFATARREVEDFLNRSDSALSTQQREELQLLTADCALAEARTRFTCGHPSDTDASSLERSLAFLEAAAPSDNRRPELLRRVAEARIWQAQEALNAIIPPDDNALLSLQTALDELRHLLAESELALPTDKLLLGRGLLLRGRLERRRSELESALATQVETARTLLEAGESPETLDALAQCYGETAEMLAQNDERPDAVRAFSESIKLLTDLITAHPERRDWRLQLSTRYAGLAQVLREHGEPNRALEYQQGAVRLLQALTEAEPANSQLAAARTLRHAELAELEFIVGQKKESLTETHTIRRLLEKFELPAAVPQSFTELVNRLHVARSYEITARLSEGLKQMDDARECLAEASSHYEAAAAVAPHDITISRELAAVKAQLAKLSP